MKSAPNPVAARPISIIELATRRSAFIEALEQRLLFAAAPQFDLLPPDSSPIDYLLDLSKGNSSGVEPILAQSMQSKPILNPVPMVTGGTFRRGGAKAPTTNSITPSNSRRSGASNSPANSGTSKVKGSVSNGTSASIPVGTTTAPAVPLADQTSGSRPLQRSPADFRYVLQPGTGFTGPTSQPTAVGDSSAVGYTATAIARWDVVPYQTFKTTFDIGVVAFDISGIDRVDFSVNGGAWTSVRQMTTNAQTGACEYTATLRASDFSDGPVEVRAVVYPNVGNPRVLSGPLAANGAESLPLYADSNGSLQESALYVSTSGSNTTGDGSVQHPYATLLKAAQVATSGAVIYLQPGTYQFGTPNSGYNSNDRWITITSAPGVAQGDVILQPLGNTLRVEHLAIQNVTIDCTVGNDLAGWSYVWSDNQLWLDNVSVSSSLGKNHTPEIGAPVDSVWAAAYLTNSRIHDYPGRAIATPNVQIVRGVQIQNIGDDAIDNPQLVVNTTIDDVVANDPADHIDAVQYFPDHSDMNSITYGVKATNVDGQLLFGGLLLESEGGPATGVFSNVAVVNYLGTSLQGPIADPSAAQIGGGQGRPSDHLLFYNVSLPNQSFYFTDSTPGCTFTNTAVSGSVFWRLYDASATGKSITASHIIDFASEQSEIPVGGFTTGDPGFVSAPGADGTYSPTGDFHLKSTSSLRGRLPAVLVPVDLENIRRSVPDSVGAYG